MKKNRNMKQRKIEERLQSCEWSLANAEEYLAQDINVESFAFLHMDDWKGKSGHPSWIRNHMVPTLKKGRMRAQKVLEKISKKAKEKSLTIRKRHAAS